MADLTDPKTALHHYLQAVREALLAKLEGLTEEQLRRPRTPTGTNLLGIVKHCLNVEAGYFGPTFGRRWPAPEELVPDSAYAVDPQADWYATGEESAADIVARYRRVWSFADETIASLPLEARGRVPWWGPDADEVTLLRVILHVTGDIAQHAGHADILREQIDGVAGWRSAGDNLPGDFDWPAYVARLDTLADRFAR